MRRKQIMPRGKQSNSAGEPQSKMGAVRVVLSANPNATAKEISEALKSQYGMDLDANAAGSYRYQILKAQGLRGQKARRRGRVGQGQAVADQSGIDDLLRAAEKLGWQRVKELVDKIVQAPG
jgi:hypothetical protein